MRVVLTQQGPLQSLIEFLRHLGSPSATSQRKAAVAVGMLWDYFVATQPTQPAEQAVFLSSFVSRLATGTVDTDGNDPLDLNWYPLSASRAREVVRIVTAFSDFCALQVGTEPLNPLVPATFPQRIAAFRRYEHQSVTSMLKHLFTPEIIARRAAVARKATVERAPTKAKDAPPYFPFSHTMALFQDGFRRATTGPTWERYQIRDMLIALLQRFGGLRVSEPFHLWVGDVEPEIDNPLDSEWGTVARVRVFHPRDGTITYNDKLTRKRLYTSRAEYLMSQWGRIPRDQMKWDGMWAGWKDPLLDDNPDNAMTVHWYPRIMGAYFWHLYQMYLRHLLPSGLDHPYLFVNLDESRDGTYGEPYRIESYTEQLEKAVTRIALASSKRDGTTSHGLRHAYAQSLRASDVSEKVIQIALHHKSLLSQQVYTRPSKRSAAHELDRAHARAREADEIARALQNQVPGEIARAEARVRTREDSPQGLLATLDPTFLRLLP